MAKLVIEDFKVGLDRRRMNETSLAGSLIVLENAHITRGGEIEKSEAYIRFCNLPNNTYGLKAIRDGFVVFGSDDITPTLLNSNPPVRYQRLWEQGGSNSSAKFTITGQVAADTFTSIKADTIELLGATTTCPADVDTWQSLIVDAINEYSGTSGYGAWLGENKEINIFATAPGTTSNGFALTFVETGTVTVATQTAFANGSAATNPNMIAVLSVALYDGKPYVIADYDDGIIRHWYNGVKVKSFRSSKGRAKFSIVTGTPAVNAVGSFYISQFAVTCGITSILVDTTELLVHPVTYDNTDVASEINFAKKLVDAINENSNASGFTASVEAGRKIIIRNEIPGDNGNGDVVNITTTGSITIQDVNNMDGGVNAARVTDIKVNSVSIFEAGVDVDWAESNADTAQAIAAAINSNSVASGYEAVSYGASVLIRRIEDGVAANGHEVKITTSGVITVDPTTTEISGGNTVPTEIEPGRYVKTMKRKTYILSESSMYYSAVDKPNDFEDTGSGFDNLSTNTSGAEQLIALANYFENLAIISRKTIQIWFVSDDPDQNQQLQVLNNTGTIAPNSVIEFGDNDVFYLSESGVRSIRARDTTNAAFVNDVGIAIDELIQEEILKDSVAAAAAVGLLEPRQGRYHLVIGNTVYVFSFFPSSKISAWSTYKPGFKIEAMDFQGQTVACRSRNAIYKIGSATKRIYDARQTRVITPFLSANDPAVVKDFSGIDIACQGTWDIYAATDPLQIDEEGYPLMESFEIIGSITGTTYNETGGENGHVAFEASCTHVALMLVNRDTEYARIGNITLHFDGGESQ